MRKTLFLIVSLAVLGISGCNTFLGPELGTLSISFGEESRSAGSPIDAATLATLRYDLTLTGPDAQEITASLAVGQTFSRQVALGEWRIEAEAFTPDDILFGTGSTTITVRAGDNPARVPMTSIPTEDTEDTLVSALDLTALVTAPVKGAAPDTTAISVLQYDGTILWQKDGTNLSDSDTFASATVYQAVVSLTAKTGYTFAGLGANSFHYAYTGAAVTNPAGSGTAITVTIVFPETAPLDTVSALDLTELIAAPAKGAAPATTISASQYEGTIAWQKEDGTNLSDSDTFASATSYQAVISLTAKTGYTFAGLGANRFSHAGATATNPAGSETDLTVTIKFPVTENSDQTITLSVNDDGEGTFSETNFTLTQTVADVPGQKTIDIKGSGYTNPRWFVDGDLILTAYSIIIKGADYSLGGHNLTLIISKNGVFWSKEISFTVIP
jgi:hypothetical protein